MSTIRPCEGFIGSTKTDSQVSWLSSPLVHKDLRVLGILPMELQMKKQRSYFWPLSEKISTVQSISSCHGVRSRKTPKVLPPAPETKYQDSQKGESFLPEMLPMSSPPQADSVEIAESTMPIT